MTLISTIFKKISLKIQQRFFYESDVDHQMESILLRDIYKKRYSLDVGLYSYGCFDSTRFPVGTTVGRYCSIAKSAYVFNRNHGVKFISLHPYLYNSSLGVVAEDMIKTTKLIIEDDVWLGHNSIICPSVDKIGRGSIVAAGAVVTKNVLPYSVVAGNPAKFIKYRFSIDRIKEIESSQWWLMDKNMLMDLIGKEEGFVFNIGSLNE